MKLSSVNLNQSIGSFMPQKNMSADAAIQELKKQLQELHTEKQKAVQRKDEKEKKKLEKQIAEIEKQIQQLQRQKKEEKEAAAGNVPGEEGDTFKAQTPQQSAGVYKISRDEKGRPVIEMDKIQQEVSGRANGNPEKPIIVKTTANTDRADREIENLKQTKAQTEQKIAASKDEKEKQALQSKLAQVNAELNLKDNDTYRRQNMQITEQKVVSRVGE